MRLKLDLMSMSGKESDLETVVYISAATEEMSSVALHGLLSCAREKNRANNITGILLYADGSFIQVLEGPPANIDALITKIQEDVRHNRVIILYRNKIDQRSFSEWSLGYRNAEGDTAGVFTLTRDNIENGGAQSAGSEVLALLRQFYQSAYPHAVA